jgi:thioredoxin reductase (NADPH)
MEEANFLTKYGSRVYIIHRHDAFHASKIMQAHALSNPKIQVVCAYEVQTILNIHLLHKSRSI